MAEVKMENRRLMKPPSGLSLFFSAASLSGSGAASRGAGVMFFTAGCSIWRRCCSWLAAAATSGSAIML